MKIDLPTALGVATVSVLCIFAVSVAVPGSYVLPGGTIDLTSLKSSPKTDGEILYEINMQGIIHRQNGKQEDLDRPATLFQQKLEEVASDSLGIKVSILTSTFFPIRAGSEVEILEGSELAQACDVVKNIPFHLQKIHRAEMFQMFAEKYSEYQIELLLYDERGHNSWFHYGFVAISGDGKYASTYFHANSCTNEITDFDNHRLNCSDTERDYSFGTRNYDDVLASLNHEAFCVIPLDPWRQAAYDYSRTINDEIHQYREELAGANRDYESEKELQAELGRLDLLGDIAGTIVFDTFEDKETQEMIQEYHSRFGPLPEDLRKLFEQQ